jgi:hypothetical protein
MAQASPPSSVVSTARSSAPEGVDRKRDLRICRDFRSLSGEHAHSASGFPLALFHASEAILRPRTANSESFRLANRLRSDGDSNAPGEPRRCLFRIARSSESWSRFRRSSTAYVYFRSRPGISSRRKQLPIISVSYWPMASSWGLGLSCGFVRSWSISIKKAYRNSALLLYAVAGAGTKKRLFLPSLFQLDPFIALHRFGDRFFDRQTLHARSTIETVDTFSLMKNIFGILRL